MTMKHVHIHLADSAMFTRIDYNKNRVITNMSRALPASATTLIDYMVWQGRSLAGAH